MELACPKCGKLVNVNTCSYCMSCFVQGHRPCAFFMPSGVGRKMRSAEVAAGYTSRPAPSDTQVFYGATASENAGAEVRIRPGFNLSLNPKVAALSVLTLFVLGTMGWRAYALLNPMAYMDKNREVALNMFKAQERLNIYYKEKKALPDDLGEVLEGNFMKIINPVNGREGEGHAWANDSAPANAQGVIIYHKLSAENFEITALDEAGQPLVWQDKELVVTPESKQQAIIPPPQ